MPRQAGSPSQSALHESMVCPPYLYQLYSAPVAAVQHPRAASALLNTLSQYVTCSVGTRVGLVVVGPGVLGAEVGAVGVAVGSTDGRVLGARLGAVGVAVGRVVGAALAVGAAVGAAVGSELDGAREAVGEYEPSSPQYARPSGVSGASW